MKSGTALSESRAMRPGLFHETPESWGTYLLKKGGKTVQRPSAPNQDASMNSLGSVSLKNRPKWDRIYIGFVSI